jgi:uncharacterized protein YpmB
MRNWGMRHWIWSLIGAAVLAVTVFFFYYTTVQRPLWDQEKHAARTVLQHTPMEKVTHTELSHSEEAFTIVYGQDAQDQSLIAWSGNEKINYIYAHEGETEAEIEYAWRESHPDAELIRIVPSLYRSEYAWEVYYEEAGETGKRKYYDYYRFEDGELLNTYTMTLNR